MMLSTTEQSQRCLRRRQRFTLLLFVGAVLQLITDDKVVIVASVVDKSNKNYNNNVNNNRNNNRNDPTQYSSFNSEDGQEHQQHDSPRGAAEALHDDALSQLPTLTILQVGSLNRNTVHSWDHSDDDDDDDDDVFLPWGSATASKRRRRRRGRRGGRRTINMSNLWTCDAVQNATTTTTKTTAIATNKTTKADESNATSDAIIEELMDNRRTEKRVQIVNNSISPNIITDDNTTPTASIVVSEPSPTKNSRSKEDDLISNNVSQEEEGTTLAANATTSVANATASVPAEANNQNTTKPLVAESLSSAPSAVEVDEEEEVGIGSVAVDYASKSAGAIILEKSHSFKGTSNLLNSDRDRYAIAPCQEKKYVVIGLSEDILVKTVKLANYERYSSHLKSFSIWGSQTAKEWVDLGTYEARFGLGEQSFDLIQPSWARYLKFKFLTHYGSEHYCTISQIKVHGRTMVQGFHEQWIASEEEENQREAEELLNSGTDDLKSIENASARSSESREADDSPTKAEQSLVRSIDGKDSALSPGGDGNSLPTAQSTNEDAGASKDDASPEDNTLDNSNLTCDSLHVFSFDGHNHVLQSASFVLSSTSRIAQTSPSQSIPDIAKGTFGRISVPATMSSPGQSLREAAARSIGNSQLFSAAVERIQVVATALGDSWDINVSSLGRLRRKSQLDLEASIDMDPELATTVNAGATDTAESEAVVQTTRTSDSSDLPSDANTEKGPLSSSVSSSNDLDKVAESSKEIPISQRQPPHDETGSQDVLHDLPPLVVHTLKRLPSADCLEKLDLREFQAKMAATRKGGSKHSGTSQAGNAIEPIFKTLTDQIKALQLTISVHEQFTKASVTCYQRVLADLALEMESIRATNEARFMKLEKEMQELKSISLVILVRNLAIGAAVVIQFVAGVVAEIVVRAEFDVPLKLLLAYVEPLVTKVLASIICVLILLILFWLRPKSKTSSKNTTLMMATRQLENQARRDNKRPTMEKLLIDLEMKLPHDVDRSRCGVIPSDTADGLPDLVENTDQASEKNRMPSLGGM